jgi:protein FAM32A
VRRAASVLARLITSSASELLPRLPILLTTQRWAKTTTPPPVSLPPATYLQLALANCSALGGSLKLKGVKDGGIKKKKKKTSTSKKSLSAEPAERSIGTDVKNHPDSEKRIEEQGEGEEDPWAGKTEAERRFEQRRQEQLEKRLAKEGIKTHKERVEEYNKYLASLSEHHDMYVVFRRRVERQVLTFLQAENWSGLTKLVFAMGVALEMEELWGPRHS